VNFNTLKGLVVKVFMCYCISEPAFKPVVSTGIVRVCMSMVTIVNIQLNRDCFRV